MEELTNEQLLATLKAKEEELRDAKDSARRADEAIAAERKVAMPNSVRWPARMPSWRIWAGPIVVFLSATGNKNPIMTTAMMIVVMASIFFGQALVEFIERTEWRKKLKADADEARARMEKAEANEKKEKEKEKEKEKSNRSSSATGSAKKKKA